MNIAVLAGGRSLEHEVSLASAAQVLVHLDRQRHRVWPVYLDRNGAFWPARQALSPGAEFRFGDQESLAGPMRPGTALDWLLDHAQIDVVLPVLHGPFGEDGTLQGMLELYGIAFVGSGCAASAVAMDKLRTREVLQAAGVPLARAYVPATPLACADARHEFAQLQASIGLPAFVKVDASGSTFGVQRIEHEAQLAQFLATFQRGFRRWFAEAALVGEEITVAVLGNTGEPLQPLPAIGIYPRSEPYFTHEAKYTKGATDEVIPPRGLSPAQVAQVQALAVRCHEALVCDGMSRTDMIVTAAGPHVLEVNTLPGMTRQSLLPQAAAAVGISFPQLLERLLDSALRRKAAAGPLAAGHPAAVALGSRAATAQG